MPPRRAASTDSSTSNPDQVHGRAVALGRPHLGQRRRLGHEHRRPARRRGGPPSATAWAWFPAEGATTPAARSESTQRLDLGVCPAHLERPGLLLVLVFQQHRRRRPAARTSPIAAAAVRCTTSSKARGRRLNMFEIHHRSDREPYPLGLTLGDARAAVRLRRDSQGESQQIRVRPRDRTRRARSHAVDERGLPGRLRLLDGHAGSRRRRRGRGGAGGRAAPSQDA